MAFIDTLNDENLFPSLFFLGRLKLLFATSFYIFIPLILMFRFYLFPFTPLNHFDLFLILIFCSICPFNFVKDLF